MAAGFNKDSEHAFIKIGKDIKAGNIPRLVLLCGKEEYLISFYTDALIEKYSCEATKQLDLVRLEGENLSVDSIIEGLETVSLMSERKIVYLPDFNPAEGKQLKGFTDSELQRLAEYIKDIPEGSMLLISSVEDENSNPSNIIRKTVEKHGNVYDFQPLDDRQLKGFIEKRFLAAGKSAPAAIIRLLMSESGYGNKAIEYNLYNLDNDIRKIIAYSGQRVQIDSNDVLSVLAHNPENNVFAMLDAIGKNRKDEAFKQLNDLLLTGNSQQHIIATIAGQLELLLSVKEMREEGHSPIEISKTLGAHQFRVKKALAVIGQYEVADLKRSLAAAYDMDEYVKTGIMDGKLALEYFIARI